jgi:hypothetical protein
LKKSEKNERVADVRSDASFRSELGSQGPSISCTSRIFESSRHGIPVFWPASSRVQRSTMMFYKRREARSSSCRRELNQSLSATLSSAMVNSPHRARALSTVLGSAAAHAPPGSHGLGRSPPATLVSAVADHRNLQTSNSPSRGPLMGSAAAHAPPGSHNSAASKSLQWSELKSRSVHGSTCSAWFS